MTKLPLTQELLASQLSGAEDLKDQVLMAHDGNAQAAMESSNTAFTGQTYQFWVGYCKALLDILDGTVPNQCPECANYNE